MAITIRSATPRLIRSRTTGRPRRGGAFQISLSDDLSSWKRLDAPHSSMMMPTTVASVLAAGRAVWLSIVFKRAAMSSLPVYCSAWLTSRSLVGRGAEHQTCDAHREDQQRRDRKKGVVGERGREARRAVGLPLGDGGPQDAERSANDVRGFQGIPLYPSTRRASTRRPSSRSARLSRRWSLFSPCAP